MIAMTDPPEPTCPRCGEYINDDIDIDDEWSCDKCGYDGEPRYCVHCNAYISPKSENFGTGLCDRCTFDEQKQQWEDGPEYEGEFMGIILSGGEDLAEGEEREW